MEKAHLEKGKYNSTRNLNGKNVKKEESNEEEVTTPQMLVDKLMPLLCTAILDGYCDPDTLDWIESLFFNYADNYETTPEGLEQVFTQLLLQRHLAIRNFDGEAQGFNPDFFLDNNVSPSVVSVIEMLGG